MKRKKFNVNNNDRKYIKLNMLLSLFLVVLFLFFSTGYAFYTQVINVGGTVSLDTQGNFYISDVSKISSTNTDNASPTWTDDDIDFHLTFIKSSEENPTYGATYNVTLKNDTFYERLISDFNFSFEINDENDQPLGELNYNLEGIEIGEVIQPLSEKTFSVIFSFTPLVDRDSYSVDGGGGIESNEKPEGSITSNSMNPTTGSIKDGAMQRVTISLNSTYQESKNFTINLASDKVIAVDSSGNALGSFTISANSEGQEYTFYIKAKDDAEFPDDTLTTTVSVVSSGLPSVNLGNITLDVDKKEDYQDTTPPIISGVTATQSNEIGVVNVSWSGSDDFSGISSYTLLVCDSDGNVINTINNISSDTTSYAVTGLSNGAEATTYNFKVYATDNLGNTASSSDISNSSTSSGYCSESGNNSYQWVFSVTRSLNNISFSGETTANIGTTYTATLTANNNYSLPNSITVTMGGRTLTSGSGYTYSSSNGRVSIPNVNGDIVITARGESSGICLIEGTKVLMPDGKYKNIEDIDYDDLMAVWSYNTGDLVYEYPIWIENTSQDIKYLETTFSDGTTLGTAGDHAVYNYDLGRFVSVDDNANYKVGSHIAKIEDGKIKVVTIKKLKIVEKKVKLYHVISSYYFNIIANDVLTTDRNIMISNQYGFTKDISWPNGIQSKVKNDKNSLYTYDQFKDIMPYYIFKGLRVDEGKYVVDLGYISFQELYYYLKMYPGNTDFYKKVETNKKGNRLWMVTTSKDKVNVFNKDKFKVEEGTYYTLRNNKRIKCYRNSIDNKCYKPGDKIKVYSGMHFMIEYK